MLGKNRDPLRPRFAHRSLTRAVSATLSLSLCVSALSGWALAYAQTDDAQSANRNEAVVQDNVRFATQHVQRDFQHKQIRTGGENPSPLPDMGDVSSSDLSPLAERALGEKVMREVRRDPDYLNDLLVVDYLNGLAARLVQAGQKLDLPGMREVASSARSAMAQHTPHAVAFEVFLVRDKAINAFALPGGYIGLHTALLLAAESDAELASVLGHEIGHVTQKHIARMQGKQDQNALITLAAILLAGLAASKNPDAASAIALGGQALAAQNYLSFSRDAEREADRIGFQMLQASGFDVQGMPNFFRRLQRANTISEANVPVYVRTHPLTLERIGDMQSRVEQLAPAAQANAFSLDFAIAKARARVLQAQNSGGLGEVMQFFRAQLRDDAAQPVVALAAQQQAVQRLAAWLGLAFLAQQDHQWQKADEALNQAQLIANAFNLPTPALALMFAEGARAQGRPAEAVNRLQTLLRSYPKSQAVQAAWAESLIAAGRAPEATQQLRRQTKAQPQQALWWDLLASAQAAQGKRAGQHQALAEKFALQGAYPAAIEQLRIAREAGDADFYQLSEIDARLHHLQREYLDVRKDEKK